MMQQTEHSCVWQILLHGQKGVFVNVASHTTDQNAAYLASDTHLLCSTIGSLASTLLLAMQARSNITFCD